MRNRHYWHALGWFFVACIPAFGLYAEWQVHKHVSVGGVVWLLLSLAAVVIELRRARRVKS